MTIPQTVNDELREHIKSLIDYGVLTDDNVEDWHYHCFNEDYYIIGYHRASEWLKKHNIDIFDAIGTCTDYERDNFGDINKIYDNSEVTVNMLVYIYGETVLFNLNATNIEELREALS
jgi:hypothetical protein